MQYVKPKAAAIPCSSTSGPPATPARKNLDNTNPSLVQLPATDICIYFQTTLKQPVMYKEEQRMLHGFADYSLGYNYSGTKSGNFIVAEAKRKRQMSQAYGQLLSYMAMIHHARKTEEKDNAIIFGVATDGFEYSFWRTSLHLRGVISIIGTKNHIDSTSTPTSVS